ncbi:hypothetical protein V6Z92_004352 [Aspergillus fumigatus]
MPNLKSERSVRLSNHSFALMLPGWIYTFRMMGSSGPHFLTPVLFQGSESGHNSGPMVKNTLNDGRPIRLVMIRHRAGVPTVMGPEHQEFGFYASGLGTKLVKKAKEFIDWMSGIRDEEIRTRPRRYLNNHMSHEKVMNP